MRNRLPNSKDLDFKLWTSIELTSDAISRFRERELYQYDISARQSAVLFSIHTLGEKATPATISRLLLRESHTVSGIINRMEKDGLVQKTKDIERKNQVKVSMTYKGEMAYRKSLKRDSIHEIVSCLTEEERTILLLCIDKLRNKALERLGGRGKLLPWR